jgi:valyl-tRNA synthetase
MVCTFGDLTDVTWWRELGLPMRAIIGRDGRLAASAPAGLTASGEATYLAELAGKTVASAQRRVCELLRGSGEMHGDPRPITHPVKFYEKGDRPLEIVTSRQWWVKTLAHKEAFLALGRELRWHPAFMRARYEDWVQGLVSDWLVSRQRFFGVPFPVWYRLDQHGDADHDSPLVPGEDALPVDPTTDVPPGYSAEQRDVPGGFTAEVDVMDTWATSSLTPQIAGGWEEEPGVERWARVFPMDLRPQAHDIIRTWLFSTVVRSYLEHGRLPWSNAAISGWILDPDRKKMSKSVGNVVTPRALLDEYGSDAVRYWAASGRPGTDTAFDEGQMRVGRKLALKLLNASKFVLSAKLWTGSTATGDPVAEPSPAEAAVLAAAAAQHPDLSVEPVDTALLASLGGLVVTATRAFEDYDYARALERTETWFWDFCDNYLELVKTRAYGEMGPERAASARAALATSLSALLRLFAPFLPFVTEEIWSWWHEGSVHRAPWPEPPASAPLPDEVAVYNESVELLAAVRRAKSEAKVSPRAPVARVVFQGPQDRVEALHQAEDDLCAAQSVARLVLVTGELAPVEVHLGQA